jgi:NAD(P)-dependent dehydrogenase (short-subunit alcohol dehydrogenase family)
MRLKDKVALVTGASNGIGFAVSELFAQQGATVFASDTEALAEPHPDGIETLALDVTSEDDWSAAVDKVVEKTGRLDILVNNAGIIAYEPLDQLDVRDWLHVVSVDQTGVFLGMREAVRVMRRRKTGSIVNISSIWGSHAVATAHSYHAVNGAVRNMSKHAAMTYATDNIRINSVHPGFIHTHLSERQAAERTRTVIDATPMKRGGQPVEVAYGCLYLASDEASFVTGTELVIDGGYLAR